MKKHLLATAAVVALLPLGAQAQQSSPPALVAQITPTPGVAAVQDPTLQPPEQTGTSLGAPEDVIVTGTRQVGRTKQTSTRRRWT